MKKYSNSDIQNYVNGLPEMQRGLVVELREAVLATDSKVQEGIKWGSIAFFHQQNICGYWVAKNHVTLLFMEGAMLNDIHGVLEGNGAKARTCKVTADASIHREAITDLLQQCLERGQ